MLPPQLTSLFYKYILIVIICITTSQVSRAQFLGNDLLQGKEEVVIPFDYIGGFIVIDIVYNDILPLKFIFDTGASNTILFERQNTDIFNAKYQDTISVIGADIYGNLKGYIVRDSKFRIDNFKKSVRRDFIVLEENYVKMEQTLGTKIDGIVGADFFKRLTVKIDFCKYKLTLTDPNKFIPPTSRWSELPLRIVSGKPYLDAKVKIDSVELTTTLLLDTGASLSLMLHNDANTNLKLPDNSVVAFLGKGLSGNILGHVGLINSLNISQFKMGQLVSNFQKIDEKTKSRHNLVRQGILGNTLLSKFYIVIDYINETLYLKPNKHFGKKIRIDKSGLVIHAFGDQLDKYIVHYVYPNSAADLAGIESGDIIQKIGRCKASGLDLDQITHKLSGKLGKTIKMLILRDGVTMKKEFELSSLFDGLQN